MIGLRVHVPVLCAAVLVAFLTAGASWLAATAIFAVSFAGIDGLVVFVLRSRLRNIEREAIEFEKRAYSGTMDEARAKALAIFSESRGCRAVARTSSEPDRGLPVTVFEVFDKYERVVFHDGDILVLGSIDRGFIHVGKTFDGSDLLVRLADEGLFESDDAAQPTEGSRPTYPSILHWVANNAE